MSKEELSKCYGEEIVWHEISLLKENPSQHCNNNNNINNIIIMDMTSILCSLSNNRKAKDNILLLKFNSSKTKILSRSYPLKYE